jgi:hypothetical protein
MIAVPLRWLCLALWGFGLCGCASIPDGSQVFESFTTEWERPPQPGDWCQIELAAERLGTMTRKLGFVTGRVERIDGKFVHLTDVTEEERILSGPMAMRGVPLLSRTTSVDSEFRLLETRQLAREQIQGWHVITEDDAARNRQTLVEVDGILVRKRRGLGFDFDVPTPVHDLQEVIVLPPGVRDFDFNVPTQ